MRISSDENSHQYSAVVILPNSGHKEAMENLCEIKRLGMDAYF